MLKLRGYIGKEVILGVCLEDIYEELVFLEVFLNFVFFIYVDVIENLGYEMFFYLSGVGNDMIIVCVDGCFNICDGFIVKMVIDMNKVYIFDKEIEVNVFF